MHKLLFVLALLSSAALHAEVKLPPVFADNMVLQQNADVALWGESKPGAIHRHSSQSVYYRVMCLLSDI